VPQPRGTVDGLLRDERHEIRNLADPAPDFQPMLAEDCQACRIVAPVLDTTEPVEKDATCLAVANIADDSAHPEHSFPLRSMR
jgi:hypothetical protein